MVAFIIWVENLTLRKLFKNRIHFNSLFSIFKNIPPLGAKILLNRSNSKTVRVFSVGINLNSDKSATNPTLACMIPNRSPGQMRGPSPNGIYAQVGLLSATCASNLSGINLSGSS